jgi:hypothetical protein
LQEEFTKLRNHGRGRWKAGRALNYYVKLRMATGNIASGLGVLALLWSTVVLLGGLVSDLPMMRFWNITLISLVMACK